MRTTVDLLRAKGYEGKIIVGGAPVTEDFAKEIRADLYAEDAPTAVEVLKEALSLT